VSGLVTDKRIKQVSRLDSYLISEVDHHYLFAPNIFQKTKSLGDQRCLRKPLLRPVLSSNHWFGLPKPHVHQMCSIPFRAF